MSKKGKKVVFLGKAGVGKTSLAMRLTKDEFKEKYESTIGAAYTHIKLMNDKIKKEIPFDLWDTAGQERFRSLAPMYYRNADVVLLVFDLSNFSTLDRLSEYLDEISENQDKESACIIVGTKKDLIDDYQLGKKMKLIKEKFEKYNILLNKQLEYIFLSSKNGDNIDDFKGLLVNLSGEYNETVESTNIELDNGYMDYVPSCTC